MPHRPELVLLMHQHREERKERIDTIYGRLKDRGPRGICARVDTLETAIRKALALIEEGKTEKAVARLQRVIQLSEEEPE